MGRDREREKEREGERKERKIYIYTLITFNKLKNSIYTNSFAVP